MNDSSESLRWCVLLHALPPKPDYFRVRIRRRLQQLGTVALKNAAYVLPATEQAIEDFEWLSAEIRRDGGEAIVMETRFVSGVRDSELVAAFQAQRVADYAEIVAGARDALAFDAPAARSALSRLRRKLSQAIEKDTFSVPERADAEAALAELGNQAELVEQVKAGDVLPEGGVWVTRRNVFVDRMSSAWLIRRFIDRTARFKFVEPEGYVPQPGERRFDMFQGEYGHEGDRCTFETLVDRFGLGADPGLTYLGEIIHDLDLHEERYGHPEAAGVRALLEGIRSRYASDAERFEHSHRIFDQLYATFTRR